jgi:hypothetical protein
MSAHVSYLRTKGDLAVSDGQVVRVVGIYRAVNTHPHAYPVIAADGTVQLSYKIAVIRLEDGGFVDLFVRPDDEMAELHDKKVVVIGRLEAMPRLEAGMATRLPRPTLHEIESITIFSA